MCISQRSRACEKDTYNCLGHSLTYTTPTAGTEEDLTLEQVRPERRRDIGLRSENAAVSHFYAKQVRVGMHAVARGKECEPGGPQ
jgi:hypothetical protein